MRFNKSLTCFAGAAALWACASLSSWSGDLLPSPERPGNSNDDPIKSPKDLSGRSIKCPRVRAVSADWSGDPWLTAAYSSSGRPTLRTGSWATRSAGAASTDTVRWTKWDPNSQGWSIPQTLVSNLTSRTSQSLAAGGTAAVYAWTTDADGNLDDASDQEVFYSTWTGSGWAAAAQLTHDTVADRNLRAVVAPSGKVFLVWQRGADLVLDRDLASAPEVAHAGAEQHRLHGLRTERRSRK